MSRFERLFARQRTSLQDAIGERHELQSLKTSMFRQILALGSASTISIITKTLAITIAVLIFFYQDFNILFTNALHDEASIYPLVVPLLFLYLVYRKRRMLRAVIPLEEPSKQGLRRHVGTICGLLLCTTAVMFYWFGSYTFDPLEYHTLTLPVLTAGLVLVLFNTQTLRQLAFSIAFLVFLQSPPSNILYGLGSALSVLSSEASNATVNALGISSRITGEYGKPIIIIIRPDTTLLRFTVDLACSGIFSLLGFVIFAVFIAYITRDSSLKKLAILLLGPPLIVLLNITRITIILAIGYYYGEALALHVFHLLGATALLFVGTLLILMISDKVFRKPSHVQPYQACNTTSRNSPEEFCYTCGKLLQYPEARLRKFDATKIVVLASVIVILVSIQAPVFALTQGPAQITIQTLTGEKGNSELLPQIEGYALRFDYRDSDFEETAKQDASLVYSYQPADTTKRPMTAAIEIAPSKSSLHPWENCLITWPLTHNYQPNIVQLKLKDIKILDNPPIIARYFAFQYTTTNDTQVVLYWFETSTFMTNNIAQQKQVKISLINFPATPQSLTEAEDQLFVAATAIANYWQPIKTWTPIALTMSQNGPTLATASLLLMSATIAYQALVNARERQSTLKLYNKLPPQTQQLIHAINRTPDEATTSNIAAQLQKLTGEPTVPKWFATTLLQAREAGLVEKRVANSEDEPMIVWKSRVPAREPKFLTWLVGFNPLKTHRTQPTRTKP